MANELSIFASSANLPAFLQGNAAVEENAGLTAHATASFPVLSLDGKRFTVVRDGNKTIVMNPKDPSSTAQYLYLVIVRSPKYTAKAYYQGNYDADNEEGKTPICFSSTGIIPDAGCSQPQCAECKSCPKNAWGSAVDPTGKGTKGKACRDAVRLAVAPQDALNDPMLLRVPPTSIKSLAEYGNKLTKRNAPYTAVVTKVSFDPNETAQKLVFDAVGYLTEAQYREVMELQKDPTVLAITGETPEVLERVKEFEEGKLKPITPVKQAPTKASEAVSTGKITPEAVKETIQKVEEAKQEVTITTSDEVEGLDGISFDN